jgi:hypothetical protein
MKGARINFGVPNSEYVLLADDDGVAVSLKNQDTDTEYIGGGGSSDFSTAKLTIVRNTAGFAVYVPNLSQEDDDIWYDSIVVDSGEYSSVLYKGYATAYVVDRAGTGREPTITVSGNAETEDKSVYITGDCTITIS